MSDGENEKIDKMAKDIATFLTQHQEYSEYLKNPEMLKCLLVTTLDEKGKTR